MANEPTNFKIYYFAMHGRASPARLAFHAAGIAYEDVVLAGPDFQKAKFTEKAPLGSIPTLSYELDGKVHYLTQSNAQLVLAAKLGGNLWFDSALEEAKAIEVLDQVEDLIVLLFAEKDEEKKKAAREALQKEEDGKIYHWAKWVNTRLANGGYIVGDKFSAADAKLFFALAFLTSGKLDHIDHKSLLAKFTNLLPYIERVKETPEVAAFLKDWDAKHPPAN